MRYNIGDRIESIRLIDGVIPRGSKGTVCEVGILDIGVRFDTYMACCHSCNGACDNGHGFYVNYGSVRKIDGDNEIDHLSGKVNIHGDNWLFSRMSIGDYIAVIRIPDTSHYGLNCDIRPGDTGVICEVLEDRVGVDWGRAIQDGHSCGGLCENGHGYYIGKQFIRVLRDDSKKFSFDKDEFVKYILGGDSVCN